MQETQSDPNAKGANPFDSGDTHGLIPGTKPAGLAGLGAALAQGRYAAAVAEITDPDLTNG